MQLLTDGVVITSPYGETIIGRDEAGRFFTALFNGVGKGSSAARCCGPHNAFALVAGTPALRPQHFQTQTRA